MGTVRAAVAYRAPWWQHKIPSVLAAKGLRIYQEAVPFHVTIPAFTLEILPLHCLCCSSGRLNYYPFLSLKYKADVVKCCSGFSTQELSKGVCVLFRDRSRQTNRWLSFSRITLSSFFIRRAKTTKTCLAG